MSPDEILLQIVKMSGRLGVSVLVSETTDVMLDGRPVSGYYDQDAKQISVAIGSDPEQWIGTLLHEYCHATQHAEMCPAWVADEGNKIDEWLSGKRVKNIAQMIKNCQEMEADNERRTVRLIKKLKAPIDVDNYCRQANSYLHFHNIMLETRKWYGKGKGPYMSSHVWPLFAKTINSKFNTNAKQREALLTCI